MSRFVGLDWGGTRHALGVVDAPGQAVAHFEVAHDAEGLGALRRRLAQLGAPAELPIALERPSGLLVDTLLQAGHPLVPIHPNVVRACRPRYRAATAKRDLGDAYRLADVLRTDGHRFRALTLPSDAIKALRALMRTRDERLRSSARRAYPRPCLGTGAVACLGIRRALRCRPASRRQTFSRRRIGRGLTQEVSQHCPVVALLEPLTTV